MRPTHTTRVGAFSTVVSPNLCAMVTGKAAAAASSPPSVPEPDGDPVLPESESPQAARAGCEGNSPRHQISAEPATICQASAVLATRLSTR